MRVVPVLIALALLAGCSSSDDETADEAETTTTTTTEAATTTEVAPEDRVPGADWVVVDPAEHGIDAEALEAAREYAFAEGRNTQGVVIVHHGEIIAEWYADGAGPDSWAASWSMAKSYTSAAVGIAVEEGHIGGVDEPMATYLPEWQGTDREAITIEDVLRMTSGLEWSESDTPSPDLPNVVQMVTGETDQLAYASDRTGAAEPGTVWSYASADTMLLSGVVQEATGMPLDEYATDVLFDPIGMEQVEWWRDADGHTLGYCCLDTTTRDFARLGLLYARDGRWGDEQVVPEGWVADSVTAAPASEEADNPYGYQWWLGEPEGLSEDHVAANGLDGQYIDVFPGLDLVVVRNGTYVKHDGPPIADPNLFGRYPSSGIIPGQGTVGPDEWDEGEWLGPIVAAVEAAEE